MVRDPAQMSPGGGRKVLSAIAEVAGYPGLTDSSAQPKCSTRRGGGGLRRFSELKQKMALVRQFCFDHGLLVPTQRPSMMSPSGIPTAACRERPIACAWSTTSAICNWPPRESCSHDVRRFPADSRQTAPRMGRDSLVVSLRRGHRRLPVGGTGASSRKSEDRVTLPRADGARHVQRGNAARRRGQASAAASASTTACPTACGRTRAPRRGDSSSAWRCSSPPSCSACTWASSLRRRLLPALRALLR